MWELRSGSRLKERIYKSMRTGFYTRLAVNNIRKNGRTYLPYIFTCIITVMMFYLVKSLSLNPGLAEVSGAATVTYTMELGSNVIGLFAYIFLFYTNSFLIKRRKKEFGLFNMLGMEKKHIALVLFLETLFTALVSLCLGLILGVALDKAMFLLITRAVGGGVTMGFFLSSKAFTATGLLFGILFLLIYIKSVFTIGTANPIALLHGGNVGEKEPKAKWFLALIGLVLTGIGYYMALTIQNPVAAVSFFFVAVILVIVGTYLLFTAGSITLLKLLRRNQRFYYKTKHFISVSGMIYRMKQNAVGLANICILSTMVLIMVSSTSCMMVGMEDLLHTRYPNDFGITSHDTESRNEEVFAKVDAFCEELGVSVTEKIRYSDMILTVGEQNGDFITDSDAVNMLPDMDSFRLLVFIPLSDYNTSAGENWILGEKEVLFYSTRVKYPRDSMELFGEKFHITERLKEFFGNGVIEANILSSYYCIVRDEDFEDLARIVGEEFGEIDLIDTYYGFDTSADEELQQKLLYGISDIISSFGLNARLETRLNSRASFMSLYGSIFFLGISLGLLFTMATVLIIYYKQISEGYEDRERFVILQKVGMTQTEVKSAIRSQVLTVFFLPLIVAGIHVAVAFPLITLVLALMNMVNVKLFLTCTIVCFLIFVVMYVSIYSLTAKTYYKIVSR